MLTILGRLDRRPPLKLGKSVLTLTESTKKYPLTAENLRPRGRLRGGVKLVIDAPGASIMQRMVADSTISETSIVSAHFFRNFEKNTEKKQIREISHENYKKN